MGREFDIHCRPQGKANGRIDPQVVSAQQTDDQGNPTFMTQHLKFDYSANNFDERYCRSMAAILGMEPVPHVEPEGWAPAKTIAGLDYSTIGLPAHSRILNNTLSSAHEELYDTPSANYARNVVKKDVAVDVPTGTLRQRPLKVIDDMGRELVFSYFDADEDDARFGLLKEVSGIDGLAKVVYDYSQPHWVPHGAWRAIPY